MQKVRSKTRILCFKKEMFTVTRANAAKFEKKNTNDEEDTNHIFFSLLLLDIVKDTVNPCYNFSVFNL